MAAIPKRVASRLSDEVNKFRAILRTAIEREINEADTVKIVTDILANVFGYDPYFDITSEYAIRSTYVDLAVKVDGDVKFLIEVKSITTDLKENHLRQAVNYGATKGHQWVILTNGVVWQAYSITLKKAVDAEKVFEFNFLDLNLNRNEDKEMLFLLAKEAISKNAIQEYQERIKCVNPNVIAAILLEKPCLDLIRRELRHITPGLKIDIDEIEGLLRNEVLRRSLIEGDESSEATRKVRRAAKKSARAKASSNGK